MNQTIHEQLKRIAPDVVFSTSREVDEGYVWDGDGPDPQLEGFDAYSVTVTATAIEKGKLVEGNGHLGGCYFNWENDEPIDDVHGYLPQMLQEAATELKGLIEFYPVVEHQLDLVDEYLTAEMQRRYEAQQK